jgi:lipopolysaccharide export system protein LptA
LKPNPAALAHREANKDPAKEPAKPAVLPGLAANSGQPIDVQADELDVDDVAKSALFRKNVIARQADATLEAAELDVLYDGSVSLGRTRPAPEEGQKPAAQSRLKTIRARGNVVMINKDDHATCETLDYDAAAERAVLEGSVVLTSGADRKVVARKVELDQKSDTALLTGDVVVTQARNVLRGQRLAIDRRKGTTRLDSPADAGRAGGRIYTLLYQTDPKAGTKGAAKPAATAPASPFGGNFRADPTAPIEIEADKLDVFDASKTAVFKVNVVAKQGEFVIRTIEMTAHYTGQAMTSGLAPGSRSQPGQGTQLTRVEARGKVLVTGRDGEQVTGDWANFDVKANTVLIGGNVTFNQGRNVGSHSRLLINLTTGEIRFPDNAARLDGPAEPAKPGAPAPKGPAISAAETGTNPACPPGVVCKSNRGAFVFYPEDTKEKAKQRKVQDPAKPVGEPVPRVKGPRAKTAEPAPWTTETEPRP